MSKRNNDQKTGFLPAGGDCTCELGLSVVKISGKKIIFKCPEKPELHGTEVPKELWEKIQWD